ncbi:MAG: penicillin-binding protein 1B, partial [Gammaproteobacteria bacterium]|nr:penicillin-binding protein 1B [Gammaproteobacteria bacterium]
FEGKRWEVPSRVYARPLELYTGRQISSQHLIEELEALRYRRFVSAEQPGTYKRVGNQFTIHLRPFEFHDGFRNAAQVTVTIENERVTRLIDENTQSKLELIRFDPLFIGGIYPDKNEDRVLIRYQDTPRLLIDTLIAVEDKQYFSHHGVVPHAILRALVANIKAGKRVQGGSTLTQQLIKNFYLSSEKSLWRKANEAIMSLLLEWHYPKEEILEAYLNEIYLGQDGRRAIHGFGLASRFYFEKPLDELTVGETAFLVGIVKGPSRYDPRRSPVLANERRKIVLRVMFEEGIVTEKDFKKAMVEPLTVTRYRPNGITPYPAFLDLVKRQLKSDYKEEDLRSAGLRIFTTLDPVYQRESESVAAVRLLKLEILNEIQLDSLQTAIVVADVHTGEIVSLVGDREARFHGFNRALDAARPVGSLIKPAIYLSALDRPGEYHLGTLLDDSPLDLSNTEWSDWEPQNYDRKNHGNVPLFSALAHSYNVASVRLGMSLGLETIIEMLNKLGVRKEIQVLPSLLLGAVELTPYEVLQLYQTMANNGFYTPLRAIRAVTDSKGEVLQRFSIEGEQGATPQSAYLLNLALQNVVENGTARGLREFLPSEIKVAGKTGTTDEKRDSWFAGYTDRHVGVVWLGTDDNKPMGLSGSAGAMKLWGEIMSRTEPASLESDTPEGINFVYIDPQTGQPSTKKCRSAVEIPVIAGFEPNGETSCSKMSKSKQRSAISDIKDAIKNLLNP